MKDKNQALWEFISKYPNIPSYLTFNSIIELINSTGLIPVSSEDAIETYTDGSSRREYVFAIAQMYVYDTGTSQTNIISMGDMQAFMDWIIAQNEAGNYPDFGEDCFVESIEPLQNMPNLAGTSENMVAKYMFQFRIVYYQEGK